MDEREEEEEGDISTVPEALEVLKERQKALALRAIYDLADDAAMALATALAEAKGQKKAEIAMKILSFLGATPVDPKAPVGPSQSLNNFTFILGDRSREALVDAARIVGLPTGDLPLGPPARAIPEDLMSEWTRQEERQKHER